MSYIAIQYTEARRTIVPSLNMLRACVSQYHCVTGRCTRSKYFYKSTKNQRICK